MLPTDSKLRDITISPANLDFGQASALSTSEKQTVTITNRTSQKVTVVWMIAGETRIPCVPDEKSIFGVYPASCDIRPKGQMDFQVTFRPQNGGTVEGELLEVVVAQKINRTFRLVDLQRFTPPWTITLRGMGHTMAARTDTQVDISETNVRFKSCPPGERTYQVVMMTNPGDMPLSYQILPAVDASKGDDLGSLQDLVDEAPFRAWPTQGIILPHQFHLIVLEFAPTVAKNDVPYVANFQVVADYFDSQPKMIRVSGRAWRPQLAFCNGQLNVTFPPTCSGIASTMVCAVKNVSEIPISYECRIPTRFRSTFWFTEPSGQLAPSESTSIIAKFCPSSESVAIAFMIPFLAPGLGSSRHVFLASPEMVCYAMLAFLICLPMTIVADTCVVDQGGTSTLCSSMARSQCESSNGLCKWEETQASTFMNSAKCLCGTHSCLEKDDGPSSCALLTTKADCANLGGNLDCY
eukprot:symbB.v1.2.039177.t1/scaffold6387.1/size18500/2